MAALRAPLPPDPGGSQPQPPVMISTSRMPSPRSAPHNLFALPEVVAALSKLAVGLRPDQRPVVTVTGAAGTKARWQVEELRGLADPEQVTRIAVRWRYADGSSVHGRVVDSRAAAVLVATGGPAAHAARAECLDHLDLLRSQRAGVRAFFAGTGVHALLAAVAVTGLVAIALCNPHALHETYTPSHWPGMLVCLALEVPVYAWLIRRMNASVSGTRLARPVVVHRRWLTSELGVAIALATLLVAAASLISSGR